MHVLFKFISSFTIVSCTLSVRQQLQLIRTIHIGSVLAIPGDVLVAQNSFVPSIIQILVMSMTAVSCG